MNIKNTSFDAQQSKNVNFRFFWYFSCFFYTYNGYLATNRYSVMNLSTITSTGSLLVQKVRKKMCCILSKIMIVEFLVFIPMKVYFLAIFGIISYENRFFSNCLDFSLSTKLYFLLFFWFFSYKIIFYNDKVQHTNILKCPLYLLTI